MREGFGSVLSVIEPFKDIEDARAFAQAIVDTVREPLLVLDGDLRVLAVSRSFYLTFQVHHQDVLGRPLYALGDGQWNIPALRMSLENIIRERAAMDPFEVEHEFPEIGRRIMLLNARCVFYADHSHTSLLLAFDDVTERRAIERQKEELLLQTEELLRQKDVLLREMEHRVANSLQIIASILMLKARTRDLGGDPPASSGRASTRHGGRCRAGAPPHICELRPD